MWAIQSENWKLNYKKIKYNHRTYTAQRTDKKEPQLPMTLPWAAMRVSDYPETTASTQAILLSSLDAWLYGSVLGIGTNQQKECSFPSLCCSFWLQNSGSGVSVQWYKTEETMCRIQDGNLPAVHLSFTEVLRMNKSCCVRIFKHTHFWSRKKLPYHTVRSKTKTNQCAYLTYQSRPGYQVLPESLGSYLFQGMPGRLHSLP